MSKNTLILIAFVLLTVIAGLYVMDRGGQSSFESELVFPELQWGLNEISSLTISRDNNLVTVEKQAGTWTVAESRSYPANLSKLRTFLQKLAKTKRLEQKTSKPELYSKLGVEDVSGENAGGLLITVNAPDNSRGLIIGNTAASGSSYVRGPDETASWLVNQDLTIDDNPVEWLDREIIDLSADRIQAVMVESGGKVLTIHKENRAQTNFDVEHIPDGRELRSEGVANALANVLKGLELDDVKHGESQEEQFLATFKCFDGLVVSIRGYEIDTTKWIRVASELDADQARQFFQNPVVTPDDDSVEEGLKKGSAKTESVGPDLAIVQKEIDAIGQRTAGWRYAIPDYKYDQINKQLEDMLKPKED